MRRPAARAAALLLAPLCVVTVLFVAPLTVMIRESFVAEPAAGQPARLSLDQYARFFGDPYYIESFALTFGTALLVAVASIVIAYPVAYLYWRAGRTARALMLVLLLSPFYLNIVVKVFGWMLVLAPGGVVSHLLVSWGILAAPIDLLNGYAAIVLVSVHRCLPFVVLLLASAMAGIDEEVLECARLCGAGGGRVLRTIVIPLSMPGVVASAIVGFSLTAASFVIPRLVGGGVGARFAPVLLYQQIAITQNWRFGAAIGVLLLAASVATIAAGARLARAARAGRVLSDAFLH